MKSLPRVDAVADQSTFASTGLTMLRLPRRFRSRNELRCLRSTWSFVSNRRLISCAALVLCRGVSSRVSRGRKAGYQGADLLERFTCQEFSVMPLVSRWGFPAGGVPCSSDVVYAAQRGGW